MKNRTQYLSRLITFLALIILISLTTIGSANGQSSMAQKFKDMTPQQRAGYQTGLMKTKLKLDTQQIVKVKAVNIKYAEKFQPIIKSDDNRFPKISQFMSLQKQKDLELKTIFTEVQFKQYKDFESEMRKKMQDKMSN